VKSKACFARSLFYGEDGTNGIDGEDRENREFKEIREGATQIGLMVSMGSIRRGYHSPIFPIILIIPIIPIVLIFPIVRMPLPTSISEI
jgi:hypothetical protein